MKKLAIALAACGALVCSQAEAKTFVGVLWPMFGPLPAIGLVELVAELKTMPDVEVETYVHQAWPSLVEDLKHLPPGTHTLIVGYSLGANSSVFVANNSKYIDTIIALQPSMLSWNPEVTGKVGHYIEIYNPNPWETFGGMGSKKLVGPNIEYIANNDSHPGAQFDPQFRDLVKSELAKLVAEDRVETAQTDTSKPIEVADTQSGQILDLHPEAAAERDVPAASAEAPKAAAGAVAQSAPPVARQRDVAGKTPVQTAQAAIPAATLVAAPAKPEQVAAAQNAPRPKHWGAFLDRLTGAARSGDLFAERSLAAPKVPKLTVAAMMEYVRRTYGRHPPVVVGRQQAPAGAITTASVAFDRSAERPSE